MQDSSPEKDNKNWVYKAYNIGETGLLYVGAVLLVAITIITDINVIGRYCFAYQLPSGFELVILMFVILSLAPMAYVQRMRGHIGVEFLKERVSPKNQAFMDLFTEIIFCLLTGLLTWQGARYAADNWNEYSIAIIQWSYWPALLFLPLGFGCLGVRVLIQLAETIHFLKKGKKSERMRREGK